MPTSKEEMTEMLKGDPSEWNRWRSMVSQVSGTSLKVDLGGADFTDANLCKANLSLLNLKGAIFDGADLTSADLSGADLSGGSFVGAGLLDAKLVNTNLVGARLIGAVMASASLIWATLNNADLTEAVLTGTIFSRTWLNRANFTRAILGSTVFGDVDLRTAMGLETVEHRGPSTIGLDTLFRSGDSLPRNFLLDAGVPEEFIRHIASLTSPQESARFHSCFISFSFSDQEFADRLYGRLREAELRVWYAPEDMQAGQKVHEQIETAIRAFDKLLIVLSEASLASEWVVTEIRNARDQERKTGKRKLFPVRLVDFDTLRDWRCFDADSGKDLGVELREFYIPDFSTWKDPAKFEGEFNKLLRALKADDSPAAQSRVTQEAGLSEQALSILKVLQQTNAARAVMLRNGQHFGLLPHGGQFGFSEEPPFINEDMQALVDSGLLNLADYNSAGDPIYAITRAGVSLVKDQPEIRGQDDELIGAPNRRA